MGSPVLNYNSRLVKVYKMHVTKILLVNTWSPPNSYCQLTELPAAYKYRVSDRKVNVHMPTARGGLTNCPWLILPRTNSTRVFVVCKQRMLLLQLVLCRERTSPRKGTSAAGCEPVDNHVFCHNRKWKQVSPPPCSEYKQQMRG